jgi:DNA repair protein RecO (recombination protein O)
MPTLATPAIILATFRYGETSKIVRLATEAAGVQSAIAKGALRPKSRFGAALQVLSDGQAHLIMHSNRELQLLTAFDLHRVRVDLAGDMGRYSAASTLAETMIRFASGEGHPESFGILRDGLDAIDCARGEEVEAAGLRAIWTLVASLGFEPDLDSCVRCGSPVPEGGLLFDGGEGGALCSPCANGRSPARLSPGDRADLESLILVAAPLPGLSPKEAAAHRRLLARYIQYHMGEETRLPALEFWIRRPWDAA